MKVSDLQSIRIKLASPKDILEWSHGEIQKPETINYRTQRPEKDGLFCEKIFGPSKDFECYCGKYKGIRFKGIVCDRCNVEVIRSSVRRERMGHIKLASPVSHIWFLRGAPSRIGMVLGLPSQKVEKVIYFASYIITKVDVESKKDILDEINEEFTAKLTEIKKEKTQPKEKKKQEENLRKIFVLRKEEISSIETLRILSEGEYRDYALKYGEIFEAGTGSESLKKIFEQLDLKKEIKILKEQAPALTAIKKKKVLARLKLFEGMEKANVRPEWMFFDVLPVLPPDLRPMVQLDGGRYASSDLNDLYRRVINRNNRLKYLLEISAPDVIIRNEKRMLQEAVDALFDNKMRKGQMVASTTGGKRLLKSLADILAGKQGRFRRNLLGKRVDYSGRSVIVPGPELNLFECGLPKIMALELFRPFVIKVLLDKELAYNIRGAARLIEEGIDEVWASLEDVVKGKLVMLNRAPTLHRLGIQAFYPRLIEGQAIKLHPLVCSAFNADFDGDQMGVYVPLSKQAQKEASDFMLASKNLLKPADGLPIAVPTKDMIIGCYFMTALREGSLGENKAFSSEKEVVLAESLGYINLRAKIKVLINNKLKETTCGRILFNQTLPEDYPFYNEQVNSKKMSKIISDLIEVKTQEEVQQTLDKVKSLGFEYSTLSGLSWGMDDLTVPKEKKALMEKAEIEVEKIEAHFEKGFLSQKEKSTKLIEIWQSVKEEIEKLIPQTLPKNGPVFSMIDSGARGSWAQPVQMAGMKGLVTSPSGRIIELPVKNSFKEGFDVLEYFISTHGARKGTADTALRTSASGYLTRRLVDVAHEVIVTEKDCGDKEGCEVLKEDSESIGQDFRFKIVGRVTVNDLKVNRKTIVKKNEIIGWSQAKDIADDESIKSVRVFSPLTCRSKRKVCQKCYGWDMGRNDMVSLGSTIGVTAAQSIGEPGTQLTMRTFHTGGVSSVGDITRGLPRVEEIFETRIPKGEGVMVLSKGKVKDVNLEEGKIKILVPQKIKSKKKEKEEIMEYTVPLDSEVFVKKGDEVEVGQALSQGSLDLKKLFKLSGEEPAKKYILNEVQRIYSAEGINIHDKHIEVIVRQMFSRLRIFEVGDSPWIPGHVVSKAELEEVNEQLKKENKKLAQGKTIILGISRVALTSDSFLSAASFQETSRVLITASLRGAEDKLHGLKENVMIGRLLPAGTSYRASLKNSDKR